MLSERSQVNELDNNRNFLYSNVFETTCAVEKDSPYPTKEDKETA